MRYSRCVDADLATFSLALVGYALLGLDLALRMHGRRPRGLSAATALVVLVHVVMVWHFRFGWSFNEAFVDRTGGFVMFHGALLLILIAPFVEPPTTLRLVVLAFAVVSLGAITASFKYEVVHWLRLPVIAVFVGSIAGAAWKGRGAQA